MLRRRGLHLQHLQLEQQWDQPDQRADPSNPLLQVTASRCSGTPLSFSRVPSFTRVPSLCFARRSEYDGDLQSQLLSKANEEDKNCSRALSVVSAVVRAAKDLLHRAFAVDGNHKIFVVVAFVCLNSDICLYTFPMLWFLSG